MLVFDDNVCVTLYHLLCDTFTISWSLVFLSDIPCSSCSINHDSIFWSNIDSLTVIFSLYLYSFSRFNDCLLQLFLASLDHYFHRLCSTL